MKTISMVIGLVLVAFLVVLIPARARDLAGLSRAPIVLRDLSPPLHQAVRATVPNEIYPIFEPQSSRSTEGSRIEVSRGFNRIEIIQRK